MYQNIMLLNMAQLDAIKSLLLMNWKVLVLYLVVIMFLSYGLRKAWFALIPTIVMVTIFFILGTYGAAALYTIYAFALVFKHTIGICVAFCFVALNVDYFDIERYRAEKKKKNPMDAILHATGETKEQLNKNINWVFGNNVLKGFWRAFGGVIDTYIETIYCGLELRREDCWTDKQVPEKVAPTLGRYLKAYRVTEYMIAYCIVHFIGKWLSNAYFCEELRPATEIHDMEDTLQRAKHVGQSKQKDVIKKMIEVLVLDYFPDHLEFVAAQINATQDQFLEMIRMRNRELADHRAFLDSIEQLNLTAQMHAAVEYSMLSADERKNFDKKAEAEKRFNQLKEKKTIRAEDELRRVLKLIDDKREVLSQKLDELDEHYLMQNFEFNELLDHYFQKTEELLQVVDKESVVANHLVRTEKRNVNVAFAVCKGLTKLPEKLEACRDELKALKAEKVNPMSSEIKRKEREVRRREEKISRLEQIKPEVLDLREEGLQKAAKHDEHLKEVLTPLIDAVEELSRQCSVKKRHT